MAQVRYTTVKRVMLIEGEKQERYMPKLVYNDMVKTKALGESVAIQSTLSKFEGETFIKAVAKVVVKNILKGYSVNLDRLGTFSPAITSRAVRKLDDCDASSIRRKSIRYTPSSDLKTEMKNVKFIRANLDIQHL